VSDNILLQPLPSVGARELVREHSRFVVESPAYVLVDLRARCAPNEVAEAYRDFATLCIEKDVRRAIVAAGADVPNAHYALRDAFTAMILANGIPGGFNLALIATTPPMRDVYRAIERDFTTLGIGAKVFDDEGQAVDWLQSLTARR
jgi:hypothetical protein